MKPITNLSTPLSLPSQVTTKSTGQSQDKSFKDFLVDSIQEVNSMQQDADKAVEQLAAGGDVTPAEVLTAVQKADIAFQMMMQVRNKIVAAYQEVQNIRV
jgi:flagellar hook-basal body complex protein FliE